MKPSGHEIIATELEGALIIVDDQFDAARQIGNTAFSAARGFESCIALAGE